MKPLVVGEVSVEAVIERDGPWRTPDDYFPDIPNDAMAARLAELEPFLRPGPEGKFDTTYQSFVLRTPRHTVLVDTCVGEDKPDRLPEFYSFPKQPWRDNLAAAGIAPEDIDFVCCTHLHVDHVGWNTRLKDGRWVPTFPNARYVFSRREYTYWEAENANPANPHGPAFRDSVLPVVEAGRAVLVDDDHAIDDEVFLTPSPGHTPGHVCINLDSNGSRAIFTGDMIHHPVQCLEPDWSTRFCYDPAQSARTRRQVLESCAESGTLMVPAHFPAPTAGHVKASGAGFRFHFLEG
jgi:glyoxylase-like metal-dependent hydrolase (beta-lactamase superfamily II)